jgi:hypothetical protein
VIQVVYFTLVAIGLYFAADWLLDRIERARGERFKNRQVVFFGIILLLALITFQLIDRLSVPG